MERLREVLAEAFDNCGYWMGAFVICEILGDHYAEEPTLAMLARMAKTASLLTRHLSRTLLSTSRERPTARRLRALPFSSFKNWGEATLKKSGKRRLYRLPSSA